MVNIVDYTNPSVANAANEMNHAYILYHKLVVIKYIVLTTLRNIQHAEYNIVTSSPDVS
jgi:hypothetical protein